MPRLNILIFPNKKLLIKSKDVSYIDKNLIILIENMIETMFYYNGLGISAPQVDVRKNIIIVNISKRFLQPLIIINPKIIYNNGTKVYKEGCLSFPNIFINVKRNIKIKIKFLNINGINKTLFVDNLLSICLQHEIDHLNGITLYNKMSKLKKNLVLNR